MYITEMTASKKKQKTNTNTATLIKSLIKVDYLGSLRKLLINISIYQLRHIRTNTSEISIE